MRLEKSWRGTQLESNLRDATCIFLSVQSV